MSKLKIFTDEHVSKAIAEQLQRRDIDVLRCEDAGMKTAADSELLEYATTNNYVLLSMDDDVTRLHAEWIEAGKNHGGIFYAPMAQFSGAQGIGPIVMFCEEWAELIEDGTGTLAENIHSQLLYVKKQCYNRCNGEMPMTDFVETTKYIRLNQRGTPVLADTNTNIVPLGVAHEAGVSEENLLEQYGINRAQLHAALSYFYENREDIRKYQAETERLLQQYGTDGQEAIDKLRK
jgi:uncharacterized protein (DUF433 family)